MGMYMKTASLLVLLGFTLLNAAICEAADEDERKAREAFQRGAEFYGQAQYAKAAEAFREAYRLRPSWRLFFNIGQCSAAAKEYGLALEAFESYLSEGGDEVPVEKRDAAGRPYVSGPLSSRMGALKAFLDAKETGKVKATALSTHSTETLRHALEVPEIDVICATLNMAGAYVDDGTQEDRIDAIRDLHDAGKFVYVIKILHAGRLRAQAEEAIRYTLQFHEFIDAWNIGMYDIRDVRKNLKLFGEVLP